MTRRPLFSGYIIQDEGKNVYMVHSVGDVDDILLGLYENRFPSKSYRVISVNDRKRLAYLTINDWLFEKIRTSKYELDPCEFWNEYEREIII